jgi:hypothetical protein
MLSMRFAYIHCWATDVFSVRINTSLCNENPTIIESYPVEAGSDTSTVTLRVVGGDERGSLKSETVKNGHDGTRTRERLRWRGPAAYTKTDPSSRQRGRPTKTRP